MTRECGHSSPLTPVLRACSECLLEHMGRVSKEKAEEEAAYFETECFFIPILNLNEDRDQ